MAPHKWREGSSKRIKEGNKKGRNEKMPALKLDDVMCPVCLCILIEPVTMPCSHNLCMPCFQQNVRETSLLCPICRKRISSWSRKASRDNCLVNQLLWRNIQNTFPDKVKRRQLGKESDTEEESSDDEIKAPPVKLSKPGEIRKEYEIQLKKLHEENEKERERENLQSSTLIKEIQKEEELLRIQTQRLAEKDHMIALLITQEIQKAPAVEESAVFRRVLSNIDEVLRPATSCDPENRRPTIVDNRRPSSSCTIPRTSNFFADYKRPSCECRKEDKCVDDVSEKAGIPDETLEKPTGKLSRSNSLDSEDSITPELRHFRPIKTAPKTPPLRLPDGRVKEAPLIHATPRALVFDLRLSEPDRNDFLLKRLNSVEEDRRKRFEGGINMSRAEVTHADRKLNLLQPLAPFSTSPGNRTLGAKPEQKYALNDLAANKENPKTIGRRRKLLDNSSRLGIAKKPKEMLGRGYTNESAKQELLPKPSAKSLAQESTDAKFSLSRSRSSKLQPQGKLRDPVAATAQEETDRLLALELHRELNCNRNTVDRRTGTKGEYNLRSRETEVSFRFNATKTF